MKKNGEQSAILHDAYFNKPPCLIRLFLVRLVLLCGLTASSAAAVMDLYLIEAPLLKICGISAAAAGIFYILASVLPAGIVYFLSFAGYASLFFNDALREKLSFFFDFFMLRLNSRLLKTEGFTIHDLDELKSGMYSEEIIEACTLGFILLGILMGLLFTITARTRFRPLYALAVFIAAAAPAFAAEIAGYHTSMAFFAAFFFALYAVRMAYELDGVFVFEKVRIAGDAVRRNEKSYRRRMLFTFFGRKLRNDIPRYLKYSANSIIALMVTGAIMLTTAHVIPDGTTFDYEAIFADIKDVGFSAAEKLEETFGVNFGTEGSKARDEYFSYSQYGDNSGGIGISEPSDSDRPVLDVTLERNDISVYLRGDIGVNFRGTSWTALRDEYEHAAGWSDINDFYHEAQYQITRQKMSRAGYEPDNFLPLQKVSLTYRQKTNVVFQPLAPYDLNYRESGYFNSYGDTVYRIKSGRGYLDTYESLALTPDMNYGSLSDFLNSSGLSFSLHMGEWSVPNGLSDEQYLNYIVDYENYVRNAYSDQNYENIDGLISTLYSGGYISDSMTTLEKAEGICRYFKENFTYSLTVDNGSGIEVLDKFLYETKQGHCALFATSTTLALRELGIPARYVTGYVVSGDGNYTSDGYLYILREKDLHAWVEVYFEGIGWLPFDPTASVAGFAAEEEYTRTTQTFTSVSSMDMGEEFAETELTTIPTTEVSGDEIIASADTTTLYPPVTDENGELISTGGDEQPDPIVPEEENKLISVIITALIVIAAIAAVVFAVYLLIKRVNDAEKRTIAGFRKKNPNRAVAEMYQLSMLILSRIDLVPGCEMMGDFAERVDASIFLKGANVFMVDVMPVFVKCEFGDAEISPVTEEERAAVYKFTSVVYRKYMENQSALKRFIIKISLFL